MTMTEYKRIILILILIILLLIFYIIHVNIKINEIEDRLTKQSEVNEYIFNIIESVE